MEEQWQMQDKEGAVIKTQGRLKLRYVVSSGKYILHLKSFNGILCEV